MRSGDSMDYETLNTEFETKKSIKFKLYSMEYVVEQKEKYVEIYAIYYENRNRHGKEICLNSSKWRYCCN